MLSRYWRVVLSKGPPQVISRRLGYFVLPVMMLGENVAFTTFCTPSTMNVAVFPLARTTLTISPGLRVLMAKNTDVPWKESTWPRMTEVPLWPGVTPWSYQLVKLWLASGGTWKEPSVFRPSLMTGASTLIAGISIRIGVDAVRAAAVGFAIGVGAAVPTPLGITVAGPVRALADPLNRLRTTINPPARATAAPRAIAARPRRPRWPLPRP